MAEYSEDGLTLRWGGREGAPGAPPGMLRRLVRLSPVDHGNALRAIYAMNGGPATEVLGKPLGIDPRTREQIFAVDLPQPPGTTLIWWPVAKTGRSVADPQRAGQPPMVEGDATEGPPPPHVTSFHPARFAFSPEYLCRVIAPLHHDAVPVGETPAGLLIVFRLAAGGVLRGARLNGDILPVGGDWMQVRSDGIGVCHIRALIRAADGAIVQTEYGGLVDFGPDGYRRLAAGDPPQRAPIRLAPRYMTADSRLAWLNRLQGFAVGEVNLQTKVVEYDLYAVPATPPQPA